MSSAALSSRDRLREIARNAMRERGFLVEFSREALAELSAIDRAAREPRRADPVSVHDLTELLWCSIDNDDSRDLDQLTVSERGKDGTDRILVAVADVDATVRQGSAIDLHAQVNTTSVYTAAEIYPMLPERLSTDLTSLNPGEERLAMVVDLVVAASGEVESSDVYRARVRNHAKLAYPSVAAWIDGRGPAPKALAAVPGLDAQLRTQDRVAQAMKARRHERGALTFDSLKTHAVFSGEVLQDLVPDERNRAQELIEDFMIAANGATARFLASHGFPTLRRVLAIPERWDRIVDLAQQLGERLPSSPDARALEAFLCRRREQDPERFPDLSLSVIKLLGSGEYAVDREGSATDGHFGLAVRDYTHSTAPNRRYPDLVTQRLLKAALENRRVPYTDFDLGELARHCTEQEDDATKVERRVQKSAAALLLSNRIGARFDGFVTGASVKGTWVRITQPTVEGRVVRGYDGLDVGDRVRVQLASVDVERGFIDFVRAPSRD